MEDIGVVCGRFQIFHLEHLQYVLAAKKECRHLIVGITSPDPTVSPSEEVDINRAKPESNPCTYYERMKMIESVLLGNGLIREEFDIVPYPIGKPDIIKYYLPQNASHFITILDEWGECKKQRIEALGYKVIVLWKKTDKKISSSMIRERILEQVSWKEFVPDETYNFIVDNAIDKRIFKYKEK